MTTKRRCPHCRKKSLCISREWDPNWKSLFPNPNAKKCWLCPCGYSEDIKGTP